MDACLKYSKRTRNNRLYVTLKPSPEFDCTMDLLKGQMRLNYPTIKFTSGSRFSVTGVVDLFDILKKE